MAAALLIGAPASGQGKTTVAAALAPLHARQGARVRCFKCGPDFLDPPLRGHSFHGSRFETSLPAALHTEAARSAAGAGEPVYECGSLRASWFHPWFASSPRLAARLFDAAPLSGTGFAGPLESPPGTAGSAGLGAPLSA